MKRKMWWLKRSSSPHLCARYLMLFCALGVIFLPTSYVWANPAGEQVVGGAATFQRDGNKLTVNQATDRLAVNWQSFNIGAGETTHFNMPSSTSAALNRVIGGNPTSIYGSLSANGILYLINPSGILVGPGGTVNAAAFMASTLDVSTEQFMNAKNGAGMNFYGSSGESIINQGNITAEKGDVFLVAQKVENRGTINAASGTAGMVGSGQKTDVMVHEVGGKGFAIRVAQLQGEAATGSNRDLPDGEELLNEGSINAAQAELNASGNVYALAIRNSGTIRAKAVVANADGTVRLDGGLGDVMNTGTMIAKNAGNDATAAGGKIDVAGQNITASPESIMTAAGGELGGNGGKVKVDSAGTTIVQGKVDVAAPAAGAKGGKVELLGERVGLFDGAKVDASGGAGGGTVLVGGDYLGGQTPKPELKELAKQEAEPVKNAKATVMADTAEIMADATVSGDGGKIILWSDEYTGFYGDLSARGGLEGGNGGFIETSSKDNLQAFGSANASSVSGSRGMWLLDPTDVTITTLASTGGAFSAGGVWTFTTPNPTSSNILNTELSTALAGSAVTIDTTSTASAVGNITVSASVTGANNLTMRAANNIALNSTVILTGAGSIFLLADYDQSGQGTVSTTAAVTAGTTGSVTLQGSGAIGLGAGLTANGGVLITPSLTSSSIAINDPTGLTSITTASLQNIVSNGTVTIGNAAGTGTISIGGTLANIDLSGRGYNLALQGSSSTVVFNFTGANTLTLKTGGVLTLNLGTGSLFSPGSATTDFTSTTGGMVLTSAGQIGSADSSAPFLTSMANLSGTTTGSINVSDAGGLTVNGALSSGNANINLSAGTGGAFANTGGTISAGAGAVILTANTINIANTVTGNGGINLVPDAAATTVAINDAAGTFSLTAAEMGFFDSTGVVSIGRDGSSSAFNIGSLGSIDLSAETYDLTIFKGSGGTGVTTFNFTAGNTLTLPNNGILNFNVGSAFGSGGTIQGSSLNTTDITIGGNGTISFNSGAVGTTQRLKTSVANYGTSTTSENVFLTSTRAGGVNFGGTFSLGPIGSFILSLNSAGAVTQDQAILASGLELLGSGSVTLNNVANNIVTLAGNVTGSGFSYTDSNAFAVGTVNTTTGLTTTSGNTILQGLTGLFNITSAISVSGGNATLQASGGNLTVGALVSAVDRNINLTTSGNLAVNSSVNAAQGVATLTANTIALGASVTGNGGINLIPTVGTTVGIGAVPTSTFGLTTTEMNFLVSTGTVTFGSSGTRVGAIGLAEGGSISLATNSYNLAFYGSGDVTFGGTLTMGNNRGLTLDVGTGRVISAASGIDLAIGGNGTLGITSSGAVGQTANGPLSTQIANLAGATVGGAFSMDNNSVNLLVNGAVSAAGNNITLTTGTGILSNTSAINSTGTVTLTTDSQDIQATIGGTGATIVLAQQTTGRAIQLGTDGPLYSLTSTELGFLQGTTVRIGATTSSGMTITAPILMPNVTNLNLTSSGISDSGGVTGISVTGLALTSNGLISLTGSGNSFSTVAALLSGSSVAGASITINDAVSMAIGTVDGLVGLNNSEAGSGTISLTSGGSITQTAAMTTGTGAITVATTVAGSDILLSTQANNLSSSLFTLGGTQANVRNFGLRNTSASSLAPVLTGATALNDVTLTYNSAPLVVPGIDITGNLSVTSGGAMTQSGNILVDGSTTLAAGANIINLSTFAGNDFSSLSALSATGSTISLKDVNGFLMGTTTATGNLTLNAGAAVTQSGIITAPGLELLGAGSFAFGTLNNAITTLAGNVTGNVSFLDNTGYAIGTVNSVGLTSASNITLSSTAAVTQNQLVAAAGLELLGGATTFTLNNSGNNISTLAGSTTTGSLNFTDSNDFAVGTVNSTKGITTTSGAVSLTALGAGNLSVQQAILAGATSTLTAGGEFSSVTSPSGLGTVEVTAGTLTITSATINLASNIKADGGTILNPSTAGQTIGLNSVTGGFDLSTSELLNLISSGTVTIGRSVDGTGAYTVGGAGAFDLSATSYDLTLEGLTSAIAFSNGITMGNGRTLNLAAGGAITSGLTGTDITIGDGFNSGTLSISSASTVGISGNALSTAIDQLGASTVGTTFLSNSRALQTTGAIGVTGNLTLNTGGTLSQSGTGAVTVSGTTAFTVPTGSDVLIANAANNLGALTLTASGGTTFRDLELRNVSASASVPTVNAIRNVLFNFDNAGVALPALTLTGTLDVIAGGGPITQTGILNITGDSSFASTGFGITLGNALNVFGSNVSLTTTALQNATLVDSTALILGTSNVSALLNLSSGGSITQATSTTLTTGAGVTASFTTAASDLLLTGLNSISGQVAFGSTLANIRDVSIQNSSTGAEVPVLEGLTNLQDLTLNYTGVTAFEAPTLQGFAFLRNISFTADGPITQKSGGISNLETASFTTLSFLGEDITLDDAANNFGLAVSLTTFDGNAILRESSGLILGTSNLGSGDLSVTTTAGTTTQTGFITASLFDINAGGSVNLTQSNLIDTVAASVTGAGNSFSFANAQDLEIGTAGLLSGITTASGDVTVSTTASGTSGIITVNNTIFAGGAGNVFMNAQAGGDLDIFANVGAAGAGTITLLAENDLTTGGTGVLIGAINTGAIVMRADSAQSDAGTLTIAANDIVGSTLNSSDYILSGADLNLAGIVRQSGVGAKITLAPTLATGYTELGSNTAPPPVTTPTTSSYVVTADELLNIQSAGTVVLGGSDYLGDISLGDLNLVGNVFKNFLLQSSPGGLTTVGNGASTGTYSIVSSGVNVEIDSRVQLDGNNLNISMTGGNNSAGADLVIKQEFLGGFDPTIPALLNGGLIVDGGTDGNVTVSSSLGLSQELGLASISGNDVTVNAIGTNGGVISLTTGTGTIRNNGNLNSTARENGVLNAPPAAGSITLRATGDGTINVVGSINAQGAQGANVVFLPTPTTSVTITQSGGAAGNVTLSAPLGTIQVGGAIIAYGGDAVVNRLPRGSDGTISIDGNNVGLTRDQIAYYGTKIDLKGRNNLIFASQPDYGDPTASVGGASIIMNQLENGTEALNDPTVMQNLAITYGETGAGQLYMGSGSSIQMFGGAISVNRIIAPTTSLVGGMTLGEIYTTGRGISSGNVSIGSVFNSPVSVNYIDTSGGNSTATSTSSQSGISGGSVSISGTEVRIGEVNTTGSSPLSTARVPAIGGTGGSLSVNGTTVSILGSISTSGGVGAGATGVRSTGGSGGQINITTSAGVILDSVNLSTPTFVFDASGGTGANGGLSGSAGKIILKGPISAAANGVVSSATTAATTLDLRFSGLAGSGTGSVVTLGTTSSDAITLGTLITAGGSGVTRGTFTVNGALQVDTLSTAAQPYSIELLGDGSVIQNRVTFLNSGTATIGAFGVTTTFTDGFDALSGATVPSTLKLGGTINTVTATTGSMLANATVLVADTTLNSAGNIIQLGSLDGTYGLTLAAGVAGGNTTFTGAVGDTTEVGQITVANGVTGLVSFGSTVDARGIQSASTSKLVFNNDVTLSGTGGATTSLGGTLTLNNQAYLDGDLTATLSILGAGSKTISATTTLSGGPIEFGGLGNYTLTSTGTINGAQKLVLSGAGTKAFSGIVGGTTALGSVLGGEEAIVISGGDVTFGALTTVNGIVSADAKVTFSGVTTLGFIDKNSSLASDVDLLGATLTSAGTIALGDAAADSVKLDGAVRVNGTGAVTVKGAVTDNAGFTSFTQAGTAGKISFDEDVTLDVAAGVVTLNGDVGLSGMTFSTVGTVTLGDALTDSITLTTAAVTLTGTGTFAVNGAVAGAQQLALQGTLTSTKTFASTVSVTGLTQDALSGTVTFQQNVTTTGVSTLGASTVLDGMTFTANGVGVLGATTMNGVTLSSGLVSLAGAGNYTVNGAVAGAQQLALQGTLTSTKTFASTVSVTGLTQDALSGTVTFQQNVTTTGVSTLGASTVLDGMTFTANGVGVLGATTMNGVTLSSGLVTLTGAGNYTVNGAVGGGQNLTLAEAGTKAFNSTLNLDAFSQTGGKVSLGGGVNTSGAVNLASVATTAAVMVNSTAAKQTYGTVVLGGNLTAQTTSGDANAVTFGGVTGSGDLTAQTSGLALNGVVANSGTFSAETSGLIDLGGTYLTATEAGRIQSSGGARFASSGGNVTATGVTMQTSLAMQALGGQTSIDGVNIKGALNMVSGGAVNFNGTDSSVSSLEFTGTKVSSDGIDGLLANIVVPSLGGITLTGSGNGLSYSPDGNLNVSGRISVNGGDIALDPSGNFVNSYAGNPFTANSTRILTKDLFSSWPSNGAVPGLQVVYGVNSIGQVSANQIGVSTTLLAGNAAPYILEFTTGTGQPYILAQQSAIPPVMLPGALTGGSGFAKAVSYSADEIEMMTPEERSTYENQQRQISARVILQGESGEGEEIGAPTEGRTPQAASPAILVPVAPTAQVLLEGKPLAGAKTDQERGDATKIIKIRPTRAVALRSGLNVREVLESERMAAEVSVGAAPVAQSR